MGISDLISFFITTDGPGGFVVLGVLGLACIIYVYLTRWILAGGKQPLPRDVPGPSPSDNPKN
jgi:hypothetical protein